MLKTYHFVSVSFKYDINLKKFACFITAVLFLLVLSEKPLIHVRLQICNPGLVVSKEAKRTSLVLSKNESKNLAPLSLQRDYYF